MQFEKKASPVFCIEGLEKRSGIHMVSLASESMCEERAARGLARK